MQVVFYIWVILSAINLAYLRYFCIQLGKRDNSPTKVTHLPLSVVICARNEAKNLLKNLPAVLSQDYPNFEVVVINDYSTDHTWQVLQQLAEQYHNLRPIQATHNKTQGNKKLALQQAVNTTKQEHLVLTDADCQPATNQWLQYMTGGFTDGKEIVLGYSPYTTKPGWLNRLIRYETVFTAMQYTGFALGGMPYMGVGRNMAYTKSLFNRSQALQKHAATLSGDDDLLVNETATATNTTVCLHPDSFVTSQPKETWTSWFHQKRRHSQAGHHYKFKHRLVLGLFYLNQAAFYPLLFILLLTTVNFYAVLAVFAIRVVFQTLIHKRIFSVFNESDLLRSLWICDFMLSVFFSSLGSLSAIKVSAWKKNLPLPVEHRKTLNWLN